MWSMLGIGWGVCGEWDGSIKSCVEVGERLPLPLVGGVARGGSRGDVATVMYRDWVRSDLKGLPAG